MVETRERMAGNQGGMQNQGMQSQGTQGSMHNQGMHNQGMHSQGMQNKGAQHPEHAQEHTEGWMARMIEEQTAKLPSDVFLWAAGGSIVGSLILQAMGKQHESLFVGQWAPTLLILGLYNKIVKVAGSDRMHG